MPNVQCLCPNYIKKKGQPYEQKKENARKAKNRKRKRKRGESAIVSLIRQLVDELTYLLCFPEGCNSHRSQHAVCEDEINLGALEGLKRSDVETLECLVSQGFFALDALPAIGQIMDKIEKR